MQAGQILNLGTANHGVGGQILNLPNGPTGGGQFYVMIPQSPVDVNHQKIAPRAHGAALVPVMPLFHIPQIPTPPPHTTTPPRHTPTNKLTEKFTRLARKHLKLAGNSQEITPPARKRNISLDSHNDMSPDSISRDTPLAAQRTEREEKRRQTHNEVERRRRDKINSWIHKLAKMVPNCKDELGTKHGGQMREQVTLKSKGGILQKTVNFIQELQIAHSQVVERLQEQNQVLGEMAKVRENLKRVEQENLLLRSQLQSHGFEPIDYASQSMQQSRQDPDTLKSCSEMNQPPMVTLSQTSTQQSVLYGQSSTMDDKDDEQ